MFRNFRNSILFLLALLILPAAAFAYEVPKNDSGTKFFYIFGPNGNPLDGKESDTFELHIDVPQGTSEQVVIKVLDADTGGKHDAGVSPWDTKMEISVSGTSVLASKEVGEDASLDGGYLQFGPFSPDQGKKVGNNFRFTLKIEALTGDDLNAFAVDISPNSAEAFSEKFTFFLRPSGGQSLYFYPEIPAGTESITVGNFDLDADGGVSSVSDAASGSSFKVNDSVSGQWAETKIDLSADQTRRLKYKVTTTNQQRGHAGIRIQDDKGNLLPIYFRKGKAPVKPAPKPKPVKAAPAPEVPARACNTFEFDATQSYDPNSKKIEYQWDFGDGNTSTQPTVSHTYAKGGTYKVTLTVKDYSGLECDTAVSAQEVDVNTPPSAAFDSPKKTCVSNEVVFNASATRDDNPANLTYQWSFGDGTTGEGETVRHAYAKGGTYDVVLTVNDGAGTSCSQDSIRQTIHVNAPPVAEAGEDITIYAKNRKEPFKVNLDGTKSYDPDKNELSYAWDFGDGTSGEGAKASHVFSQPGSYTARLNVNDNSGSDCSEDSDTVKINVFRGPVAIAGDPQNACSGSTVQFDGSASEGDGDLQYLWNFGDGETGEGASVSHRYQKGGRYTVNLTVDDGLGTPISKSSDSTSVVINSAPNASLASVEPVCVGSTVSFDASGSSDADGDSLKYVWDFGDGSVVEGKSKMSHSYKEGGNYTVKVTVDDGKGGECSSSTDSISVKVNAPPVANAGPNLTCCEEQASTFDGTASTDPDGDSLSYRWDFGDGNGSTEAKTSHAYEQNGQYRAVLTVDDGSGTSCSTSTAGFVADVNARPVPVIKIKQK